MDTKVLKSFLLMYFFVVSGVSSEIVSYSGENKVHRPWKISEKKTSVYGKKFQGERIIDDLQTYVPGDDIILFGGENKNAFKHVDKESNLFKILTDYERCLIRDVQMNERSPHSFEKSLNELKSVVDKYTKSNGMTVKYSINAKDVTEYDGHRREKREKMVIGEISEEDRTSLRLDINDTADRVKKLEEWGRKVPGMKRPLEELMTKLKEIEVEVRG